MHDNRQGGFIFRDRAKACAIARRVAAVGTSPPRLHCPEGTFPEERDGDAVNAAPWAHRRARSLPFVCTPGLSGLPAGTVIAGLLQIARTAMPQHVLPSTPSPRVRRHFLPALGPMPDLACRPSPRPGYQDLMPFIGVADPNEPVALQFHATLDAVPDPVRTSPRASMPSCSRRRHLLLARMPSSDPQGVADCRRLSGAGVAD